MRTEGVRARLERLERLAGRGRACPFCLVVRRPSWPDPAKPRPKDPSLVVAARCRACDAPVSYDLSDCPEDLREVHRLYYTFQMEDRFTDRRSWASIEWVFYCSEARKHRREVLREMRKLSAPDDPDHLAERLQYMRQRRRRERERAREHAREKDPDAKFYKERYALIVAYNRRLRKRYEARYGKDPFAELRVRVEAIGGPDYEHLCDGAPEGYRPPFRPMFDIRQEAESWLRCAELERVILGEVSTTTTRRLAGCERLARKVVAISRQKYEAKMEEHRKETAERERQRVERVAATSWRTAPAQASPPPLPTAPIFPPPAPPPPPTSPPAEAKAPADPDKPATPKKTGMWPSSKGWQRRSSR